MRDFMKMTGQSISDMRQSTMVNTQAISKLEMQMGQLANHLGERDKGKLPSQAVNNPKWKFVKSRTCAGDCHSEVREESGQ
jgi:hypothetical protein